MYPPNSKLQRVVDAASEPLSLAQAKLFLRVEIDDDDSLISSLITAARLRCEQLNDRSFINTTWTLTLDYLPASASPFLGFPFPYGQYGGWSGGGFNRVNNYDGSITLPMPPLVSVQTFDYLDMGGNAQTIDPSTIIVSPGTPGKLYPAYATFFPLSQPRPAAVNITYLAGYGPDATYVPQSVVTAISFLLAVYYENRTGAAVASEIAEPEIVMNLLAATAWGGYA